MKKKKHYRLIYTLGTLLFFVCIFLGEFIIWYFYIGAGLSIIGTLLFMYIYSKEIKVEDDIRTLGQFSKNIRKYVFKESNFKISNLEYLLNQKNYSIENNPLLKIYYKGNSKGKTYVIVCDIVQKAALYKYMENFYLEYKRDLTNGPVVYAIILVDKDVDKNILKEITTFAANMKLTNQIRKFSMDEDYIDPIAPLLIPVYYTSADKLIAYYTSLIYKSPIRKAHIKKFCKLINYKSSLN